MEVITLERFSNGFSCFLSAVPCRRFGIERKAATEQQLTQSALGKGRDYARKDINR